jgi:hypothetical protein
MCLAESLKSEGDPIPEIYKVLSKIHLKENLK